MVRRDTGSGKEQALTSIGLIESKEHRPVGHVATERFSPLAWGVWSCLSLLLRRHVTSVYVLLLLS